MLLSRPEIFKLFFNGTTKTKEMDEAVASGKIGFDPGIELDQIGQTSIDLRLGSSFWVHNKEAIAGIKINIAHGIPNIDGLWHKHELRPAQGGRAADSWELGPGDFALGWTHEIVHIPKNLAGFVEGRSSFARLGLSVHQSAPWIHPGFRGPIFLEIKNSGSCTIDLTPLVVKPCQLSFFQITTELKEDQAYGSLPGDDFQDQSKPSGDK